MRLGGQVLLLASQRQDLTLTMLTLTMALLTMALTMAAGLRPTRIPGHRGSGSTSEGVIPPSAAQPFCESDHRPVAIPPPAPTAPASSSPLGVRMGVRSCFLLAKGKT